MWYIIKPILYIVLFIIIVLFSIFVYVLANKYNITFKLDLNGTNRFNQALLGAKYVYIKHSNPFEYADYTLNFLK